MSRSVWYHLVVNYFSRHYLKMVVRNWFEKCFHRRNYTLITNDLIRLKILKIWCFNTNTTRILSCHQASFNFKFRFFFRSISVFQSLKSSHSQNFIHLLRLRSRNRIYPFFLRTRELLSDKYLLWKSVDLICYHPQIVNRC